MPWIRLMLRQRVGPTRRESAVLHAVVTANAVGEALRLQCQSMTDAGGGQIGPEKLRNLVSSRRDHGATA